MSQMEETPSKDENIITEEDGQEIPLQLFDAKETTSEDYMLPVSDVATTVPAKISS